MRYKNKFKVGDYIICPIAQIPEALKIEGTIIDGYLVRGGKVSFDSEDEWELVSNSTYLMDEVKKEIYREIWG